MSSSFWYRPILTDWHWVRWKLKSDGSTLPFELWGGDGYALAPAISVRSMYEAGLLSFLDLG